MNRPFLSLRFTVVFLGIAILQSHIALSQTQSERVWLAGRYDQNRIVVYFGAVQFHGTLPATTKKIVPTAGQFFEAVELSPEFIAPFQKNLASEHFALGDHYDLILEENHIATVSLTTLIGCETDEGVGNDSYIGALATLNGDDLPYFRKDYYALRRHQMHQNATAKTPTMWVRMENEPVEFSIQSQIVGLLTDRMKVLATDTQRRRAESTSPVFQAQAFRLADGSLRYYARALWKPVKDLDRTSYALGAWVAPLPKLRILAVEERTCGYEDFECVVPNLLNVVDLGGKTGLILSNRADEYTGLSLVEYGDGLTVKRMRTLQSIGAGE